MTKYIGSGQIAVMFAAFGILWCVSGLVYTDCTQMLTGCVAVVLIAAVMSVPLIILSRRNIRSVPEELTGRLGAAGRAVSMLYVVYFVSAAAVFLKKFCEFVSEKFFTEGGILLCIILLGLVCVYISHTGAEAVCRMSTVVLFLLAVTVIMWIIMGAGDIDFSVMKNSSDKIFTESIDKGMYGAISSMLVCMCILCRDNCSRIRKGIYIGLAAFLAVSAIMIFLSCTMLGAYIELSEYPVLDSVIYSSREITFRPDGIYFLLWTITAAAVVSLLCTCGARSFKAAVPGIKGEGLIISSAAAVTAAVSALAESNIPEMIFINPAVSAILTAVIPFLLLVIPERRMKKV